VVRSEAGAVHRDHPVLRDAEAVLGEALERSLQSDIAPETLFTIAAEPWREIAQVARGHGCETVLVGLSDLTEPGTEANLERLLAELPMDAVIVRSPPRWRMGEAQRILVPIGGRGDHSHLRARLLASLSRSSERSLTFLHAVAGGTSPDERHRVEREIRRLARDEAAGPYVVEVEPTDEPVDAIAARASEADLVVLGMQRRGRGSRPLGELALAIAHRTDVPLVLISRRPARSLTDLYAAQLLSPLVESRS
jgi:nucleotide-binding universal stress UspA family protein